MKKLTTQDTDTLIFLGCMVVTAVGIGLTFGAPLGTAYVFLVLMGLAFLKLTRGPPGDDVDPKV